jgi:hypothetical protein
MKKTVVFLFALAISVSSVMSQNNMGVGTNTPDASAILDLTATDMGLLIPRVTLLAVGNGTNPVSSPATGLLVYNSAGALATGFYYWDGSQWVQVGATGASCVTLDEAYDCGGSGAGNTITADNGALEVTLPSGGTSNSAIDAISNKALSWSIGAENTSTGVAVLGEITGTTNTFNAIQGSSFSNYNSGGGIGSGGVAGFYEGSGDGVGVYGSIVSSTSAGIAGVFGYNARTNGGFGVNGQGYAGVVGEGVLLTQNCFGVYGTTTRGVGTQGETDDIAFQGVTGINYATYGSTGDGIGVMGDGLTGVWGQTTDGLGYGVFGINGSVSGTTNNIGVGGQGWIGVHGVVDNTSGTGGFGVFADGDLGSSGTKSFVIDHPLDPENKLLKHYCIESPEVLNMYRGNVVLNQDGEAVVDLPNYFESININYSYILTPIGAPANLYIKNKIENGRFEIAGGKSNMEVSWTVYAERNDAYVKANPSSTEVEVQKRQSGTYIAPELFGQPKEKSMFGFNIKNQETLEMIEEVGTPKPKEAFKPINSNN